MYFLLSLSLRAPFSSKEEEREKRDVKVCQPKRIMVVKLANVGPRQLHLCSSRLSIYIIITSSLLLEVAVPAMSGEEDDAVAAAEEKLHCASCGIAQVDDVKLTDCNSCVRCCTDKCEANHKSEHEEDCKKRAAELRDELLFKQLESTHFGDCPICMLPMPLDNEDYELKWCCSKLICNGCHHQCTVRELQERDLFPDCQFCREPLPHPRDFEKKFMKQLRKRVKANDPVAMYLMGGDQYAKGNYVGAFEWYTKAAGLGYMEVHYKLATMYQDGLGVEKDVEKTMHHFEEAAILRFTSLRMTIGRGQ